MPLNSRQKGKRGELQFALALREAGFKSARRGQQFRGGPGSADVVCAELPNYHFEIKFTEITRLESWMAQAVADAGDKVPVVAHRKNRSGWVVVLRLEDFLLLTGGGF